MTEEQKIRLRNSLIGYKKHLRQELYLFIEFARNNFPDQIEGKTGCYIYLPLETILVKSNFTFRLGFVPSEKKEKYSFLSQEKSRRIKGKYVLNSFNSRNPDFVFCMKNGRTEKWGRWGGAVCAEKIIVSCSGFSEILDECFSVWVLNRFFGIPMDSIELAFSFVFANKIGYASRIDYVPEIYEIFSYLREQEQIRLSM